MWVIAHRGASAVAPENTLAAFRQALEMGAGFIETDLQRTRDARLVALHDRIAARPRIAAYLASDRRIPFNQHGIFRHYPELDA